MASTLEIVDHLHLGSEVSLQTKSSWFDSGAANDVCANRQGNRKVEAEAAVEVGVAPDRAPAQAP